MPLPTWRCWIKWVPQKEPNRFSLTWSSWPKSDWPRIFMITSYVILTLWISILDLASRGRCQGFRNVIDNMNENIMIQPCNFIKAIFEVEGGFIGQPFSKLCTCFFNTPIFFLYLLLFIIYQLLVLWILNYYAYEIFIKINCFFYYLMMLTHQLIIIKL